MDNEVKERLRNVTRRLSDASFAKACDHASNDGEFQEALDALVSHLKEVRKRSLEMHAARELV